MRDMRSFGPWLRQQRKARGWTQEDLATRLACSASLIRKLEAGQRVASPEIAAQLAALLGIAAEERPAFVAFGRGHPLAEAAQRAPWPGPSRPPALAPPTNLPAPLTPLIGREQELASLREGLLAPHVRLLTLTGPPGIGKTRLGLEAGLTLRDHFVDGVFLVSLAPTNDPDLVPVAVARVLGVSVAGSAPATGHLVDFLREKHLLLLLDNFEQVLDAAPFVLELLGACPALQVLITSREALHVHGEQQFPVAPLRLPDPGDLPRLEALAGIPAVALFVERARAVWPGFALSEGNAPAVAAICTRLDGLPLAIELAAARVKLFSPQEIQGRLESHDTGGNLAMLASGPRNLPARQRTLRDAIEWSYALLSSAEQRLFARLGVFVGGCTLAAAEAVCNPAGDAGMDVEGGLASLVDKSLVQRAEDAPGQSRYAMLAMLREYAAERLATAGETGPLSRRHAEYHLAFAEAAAAQIEGPEQALWLARIERVHDDMRAALRWSQTAAGEAELGLRLAEALAPFWTVRGHFHEAREWLARLLAHAARRPPAPLLARAYARAGRFAFRQSDYAAARGYYMASLAISRAAGDRGGIAGALKGLGNVATEEGAYREAWHLFEEALPISRALGDLLQVADCLVGAGWAALHQSDYARATAQFDEALALCRRIDHREEAAFALSGLGELAVRQGDYGRAVSLLEESLALRRAINDRWGIAIDLGSLAWVALRRGDEDQAGRLLRDSLRMREELGDQGGIAWCLERFAELASRHDGDDLERAATLYAAAAGLRQRVDSGLDARDRAEQERRIAAVRAQMAPAHWVSAWTAGEAMLLPQAVAYATQT